MGWIGEESQARARETGSARFTSKVDRVLSTGGHSSSGLAVSYRSCRNATRSMSCCAVITSL